MWKIILNGIITFWAMCLILGCASQTPINVTFKDGTLAGSPNYVITAVYLEDKGIRDKFTDILIKSDIDDLNISLTKELGETFYVSLKTANKWYSITELISQNATKNFAKFSQAEATTYIINSEKEANLQFKAVGGDYVYNRHINSGELVNTFEVSKVFDLKIEKISQNTWKVWPSLLI